MVSLMNVSFSHLTLKSVLDTVSERVVLKRYNAPLTVFTPNTEQLLLARRNPLFLATLQSADIRIPDSIGLARADWWRAFTTGKPWELRDRVAGVDCAEGIMSMAAEWGLRVCLVGGDSSVAKRAVENLKKRFRGLDVVMVEVGEVDIREEGLGVRSEAFPTVEEISALKPDVIFVGLGAPKQEMWVQHYQLILKTQVMMVVGGAIDMWGGKVKRAPRLVRSIGLEWLWRLCLQPWRITRQWRLIEFMWLVLWGKWG
jgi:N-acetylglucosaminyldiphosphoundecaprenol N-acetyl-beta-D-mannosaminyltransferase